MTLFAEVAAEYRRSRDRGGKSNGSGPIIISGGEKEAAAGASRPRLVVDEKGLAIWNVANAVEILTKDQSWRGVLGFNSFTMRREVLTAIPGQFGGSYPRVLEEDDYTATQEWFNRNGFPRASAEIVGAAVRKACRVATYDPLVDYLDWLDWDGKPRLEQWLTHYCCAESSVYVSEVGRRWCISAVARAYKPGCKADHMLVLEGDQGRGKSSALAALAGEDWFSDSLPQMGTKDASSYLRGCWIVEIAELESMRRELDSVKAFISRQVEIFRPVYAREEVSEPRRCVFAGTTNKSDWQRDETGGRRFWPVKIGDIDVDDRAQVEVAERGADDPWHAWIVGAAAKRTEVTAREILQELGILPTDMTIMLSKRVTKVLVSLGWERSGRVTRGPLKGNFRYVPGRVKEVKEVKEFPIYPVEVVKSLIHIHMAPDRGYMVNYFTLFTCSLADLVPMPPVGRERGCVGWGCLFSLWLGWLA